MDYGIRWCGAFKPTRSGSKRSHPVLASLSMAKTMSCIRTRNDNCINIEVGLDSCLSIFSQQRQFQIQSYPVSVQTRFTHGTLPLCPTSSHRPFQSRPRSRAWQAKWSSLLEAPQAWAQNLSLLSLPPLPNKSTLQDEIGKQQTHLFHKSNRQAQM